MVLFWEIVGAVTRWGLTVLGTYLVTNHVLSADQTERATDAIVKHIFIYGPAIASLAWSLTLKWWEARKRRRLAQQTAYPPPYASLGAH